MKTAKVNYHISSPDPQAFHFDAGGVEGKLVSPVLETHEVSLKDVRDTENHVDFTHDSIAFLNHKSAVQNFNKSNDWKEIYNQELSDILAKEIGAKEVIVFDHTIRIDDPKALRQPARNVHGDYSKIGAHQRLHDLLDEDTAKEWEKGHFGLINIWRPINNPINSSPLGFIRPKSVKADDWVDIGLVYPDREGHILGVVQNEDHEWIYMSNMTPDEVVFFNVYDNQGLASVGHGAMDGTEDEALTTTRMSLESRTLVRYA